MVYQNFVLIISNVISKEYGVERDKEVHDHVNKERKYSLFYVATGTQFHVSGENGNG